MAKIYFSIILILSLVVLIGCQPGSDTGISRREAPRARTPIASSVAIPDAGEIDLVETVIQNREDYRRNLEMLIRYYNKAGNNSKLLWATKELESLNTIPQYKYIVPVVAAQDYRATTIIPDADTLYEDALLLEKEARAFGDIVTNKDKLRLAMNKYDELIQSYPTSDKIDDAAYKAGEITEYFNDYTIAFEYYERTYQWDEDTQYPARFRAARILDKNLYRKDEALDLYKEAIATEGRYGANREWKDFAEQRVAELEGTN